MTQPAGSIKVGGTSPPNQYYDIGSLKTAATLPAVMYAYVISSMQYMPAHLTSNGSSGRLPDFNCGISQAAATGQTVQAIHFVNDKLERLQQIDGAASVQSWEVSTVSTLPSHANWYDINHMYGLGEVYCIHGINLSIVDMSVGAGSAFVNGVHIEQDYDADSVSAAGVIARENHADRVYSPGHFVDSYLAMDALCKTYNSYTAHSSCRICCPIFGNTA